LYMLLMFQKSAVRENYETEKQTFSMRLRFLTIRDHRKFGGEQAVVRDAAPVEPSKQWLKPLGMPEQDRNPWR